MILSIALLLSLMVLLAYLITVRHATIQLKRVHVVTTAQEQELFKQGIPSISVIIPAFNEEENIDSCVRSALNSSCLPAKCLEVLVIDDQSTDRTWKLLQQLQHDLADSRLKIMSGKTRPAEQRWTGKNWACYQAAQHATGEFLLFIDADVQLKPGAIAAALQTMLTERADLLTCIPTIVCGSVIEYLVQPLIFINLMVTFNSDIVKDPKTDVTYALGPFLLFKKETYHAIGGHQAIGAEVAEDVAFALLIKRGGFKLQHALGSGLARLRMYRTLPSLWEGWTKVLYVGAHRSVLAMGLLAFAMVAAYVVPVLGLAFAMGLLLHTGAAIHLLQLGLAAVAMAMQYKLRTLAAAALSTPPSYWWLQSVGALLIAVMAIVSIIKAETGWGWTWRGRSLKGF